MVQVTEEQAVGDKPCLVLADHSFLADLFSESPDLLDDRIVGNHGANDLNEVLNRSWVEKVQTDNPRRLTHSGRDLGYGQGRCVGAPDDVFGHQTIELGEHVALEVKVFGNRLDNNVRGDAFLDARSERDAIEDSSTLVGGELVTRDRPFCRSRDSCPGLVEGVVIDINRTHGDSMAGDDLGDAGTHGAHPDHRNDPCDFP